MSSENRTHILSELQVEDDQLELSVYKGLPGDLGAKRTHILSYNPISQASCGSCGIGRAGLQVDAPRRFSNRAPARPGGLRSPTHPALSVAVRPWDARQIGALVGNVISVPAFRCEARRAAFRISHLERRRPLGAQLPTCSSCVRMAFAFDPRWIRGGNAFDPPLLRIGSIGLAGEAAVPSGHDTLARWAPPRLGPAARSE